MSSSEPDFAEGLERDLPTSPEDVEVLRRLRRERVEGALRNPNRLRPPAGLPAPRERGTSEGWEELELPP